MTLFKEIVLIIQTENENWNHEKYLNKKRWNAGVLQVHVYPTIPPLPLDKK